MRDVTWELLKVCTVYHWSNTFHPIQRHHRYPLYTSIWKHTLRSLLFFLKVTTDKHHLHNLKSYGSDIIKSLNKLSKTARFVTSSYFITENLPHTFYKILLLDLLILSLRLLRIPIRPTS